MQVNVVWVGCMKKNKDGDDYCGLKSANSSCQSIFFKFSVDFLCGRLTKAAAGYEPDTHVGTYENINMILDGSLA